MRLSELEATYVHHSVTRCCLHVDAVGGGDDLRMECGPVCEQIVVRIALQLRNVGVCVWKRHDSVCLEKMMFRVDCGPIMLNVWRLIIYVDELVCIPRRHHTERYARRRIAVFSDGDAGSIRADTRDRIPSERRCSHGGGRG